MGNRSHHPVEIGALSESKLIAGHMKGAGAANLTFVSGDVVSATRSGAGTYDLVFRHKYAQGIMPFDIGIVGTTVGLDSTMTAWNPSAGTGTIKFAVGNTPTDPATTDDLFFLFLVRNSGRNPTSW